MRGIIFCTDKGSFIVLYCRERTAGGRDFLDCAILLGTNFWDFWDAQRFLIYDFVKFEKFFSISDCRC